MVNQHKLARSWGLLPSEVKQIVLEREWRKVASLKARLLDRKPFPIRIGLKPPEGRTAVADMAHFQRFIEAWQSFPQQSFVQWEPRVYRALSQQLIPKSFVLQSIQELITYVGDEALSRSHIWTTNMSPLLKVDKQVYPVLVQHLSTIEKMSATDSQLLAELVGQLYPNMGTGQYLRALPLVGVDTKFLENHQTLITGMLDILHQGSVANAGGLLSWLGCASNPKGWLTVRPLCGSAIAKMGGFPVVQIPGDILKQHVLPAKNILVVENMQSGLGLPELEDTIAVIGGGKNVAWMDAKWLNDKRVAYWGDIDTWGLSILSDVRSKLGSIIPLMMDRDTLRLHSERMVIEQESVGNCPQYLSEHETQIFNDLKSGYFNASRLEQERLSSDYIVLKLQQWVAGRP